ncbi:MAG: hypothetical protein LBB66_09900 [Desulfovibrio sp.]|jgi:hypothetical protein|nr:hypothetical protein [Desulfovibrio sp.]
MHLIQLYYPPTANALSIEKNYPKNLRSRQQWRACRRLTRDGRQYYARLVL